MQFFNRTPLMDRAPLKKIKNILLTFSFPRFTVHNPTSKDVLYTARLLYGAMYSVVYERGNRFLPKSTLTESHEKKFSFSSLILLNLVIKGVPDTL